MTPHTLRTRLNRSISQLIGWFFGTFWALLGAFALPRPYDRTGCALALVVALIILVMLWRSDPDSIVLVLHSISAWLGKRMLLLQHVLCCNSNIGGIHHGPHFGRDLQEASGESL